MPETPVSETTAAEATDASSSRFSPDKMRLVLAFDHSGRTIDIVTHLELVDEVYRCWERSRVSSPFYDDVDPIMVIPCAYEGAASVAARVDLRRVVSIETERIRLYRAGGRRLPSI